MKNKHAVELGKLGGKSRSEKKVIAARINGTKPCRPGKRRGCPKGRKINAKHTVSKAAAPAAQKRKRQWHDYGNLHRSCYHNHRISDYLALIQDRFKTKMIDQPKPTKPQLHQSHLATLYRCGHKFERIYIRGEKEPPTTPLVIGIATHASIARNLTNKIEKGTLLTREAVQDYSRDEFVKAWQETPIILNKEEQFEGLNKTKATCQDATIELSLEHHYSIAPKVNPKAVERKWVLEAPGYPFDMAGTIDIDEIVEWDFEKREYLKKNLYVIRDTKTKAKNIGQREVDTSEQYSFYHFAKYMMDGIMADYVIQDNLIKPTKKRKAFAVSYASIRTADDHEVVKERFGQACSVIEKGAFTPANPSDWWCSKDFCGFAAAGSCKYFNSKRSMTITKPEEKENGTKEQSGSSSIITRLTGSLHE